jgi:hypothetical protein
MVLVKRRVGELGMGILTSCLMILESTELFILRLV